MIAARVPIDEAGEDTVEGFHVLVGGGFGADAGIARELYRDVKREDCPRLVERILAAYVRNRAGAEETFLAFSRRHDAAALQGHGRGVAAEAPHERADESGGGRRHDPGVGAVRA